MGGEPPQHGALCRSLQRALPWHAGKLPPTAALSRCSLDAILMVREVWQWLLSLPAAFSTRFGCCSCRLWATSASSSWTCQLSPRAKLICEISCALSHARQSHRALQAMHATLQPGHGTAAEHKPARLPHADPAAVSGLQRAAMLADSRFAHDRYLYPAPRPSPPVVAVSGLDARRDTSRSAWRSRRRGCASTRPCFRKAQAPQVPNRRVVCPAPQARDLDSESPRPQALGVPPVQQAANVHGVPSDVRSLEAPR